MDKDDYQFQLINWEDIQSAVRKINPELVDIIDKISPSKRYPFVKASYRFGDLIVKNGITQLPTKEGLLPINNADLQKILKDKLSYSRIPLFLTLQNANEVFIDSISRSIPLNLFYPGSLLGLFESIDFMFGRESAAKWCVSAGARHFFTLPKINEISGFKRLKMTFGLDSTVRPRYLTDHWRIFYKIARHPNFEQPWQNEVLFFTQDWLVNHYNDLHWFAFKDYLFKQAWFQAQFAISNTELNLIWEYFADAIYRRRLKLMPYLMDQVKHIMLIATGRRPGFRPADTSDQIAPVYGLQKAIVDIYGLKKYFPTMMHTSSLERDAHLPLYYSLSYPTLSEGSPHNQAASTIMLDLRDIKQLTDMLKPIFDSKKIDNPFFRKINFDYFHVEEDKHGELKSSKELIAFDKLLLADQNKFPDREFCSTSQFWRGCIRIRN